MVSATEAHGVIAMEDYIRAGDRSAKIVHAAGHYTERYRFEDGAWRIAHHHSSPVVMLQG